MSSSSYEKVVKMACKPKAAPPKTKYMDPIIAATWSEDGAVHDVCKALTPRFREPNAIVVFKALIVLHTMIRNGATDNVLGYLSSSEVLRLRNISAGHWEGYAAPQNLQSYATYLDTRIRAYRDLKHDAIRVQSETNRDLRNSMAIEEGRIEAGEKMYTKSSTKSRFGRGRKDTADELPPSSSGHQRSKTMAGRKLRVMTVEKGLLRETKIVQKMIDSLVECRFYLDDLEDELNITALRMLVKDLLILFQACNEGVINVLEHYFEMSKIDAKEALGIYRHFCKETERVVEYLSVAKKLQNLLNVPIPNLRHAPVSLAGSLEEYLNDPNFEQNRIEYKTQKDAADKSARTGVKVTPVKPADKPAPSPKPNSTSTSQASSSSTPAAPKAVNQAMVDFFTAIEEEQPQMFNPQTNSPTSNYFQQQATYNPFSQQPQMTGVPFGQPQMQMQATGMFQPQQTNPFGLQQPQPQQQFGGNFLQAQPSGFLQAQTTGAPNPFRQSMLMPNATGMPSFGGVGAGMQQGQPTGAPTNPFPLQAQQTSNPFPMQQPQNAFGQSSFPPAPTQASNPFPQAQGQQGSSPFGGAQSSSPTSQPNFFGSGTSSSPSSGTPFTIPTAQPASTFGSTPNFAASQAPPRPASAPLRANTTGDALQPVKSHQTGSRNPFGVPVAPAPPVPKVPTLMELAMGVGTNGAGSADANGHSQGSSQLNGLSASPTGFNPNANGQSSTMSSIASGFSFGNDATKQTAPRSNTLPLTGFDTGATSSTTTFSSSVFSALSPQTTAASSSPGGTAPSISVSSAGSAPLQPQTTGFGGIKAFKPSSSFGAALLESLPTIPQSPNESPNLSATNSGTTPSGTPGLNGSGPGLGSGSASPSFQSGLTTGVGLRPQATGLGGPANPFRASMFNTQGGAPPPAFGGLGGSAFGGAGSASLPALGTNLGGAFGGSAFSSGQQQQQQAQQNGSLI
ncbi:hypothetical protein EIP91_003288 [Steccherinum ochraceum]|uniref:ENTH domain-containing protein n=1 Tax=Steccherinum ochraceum TaxID=92696 RepID=A0A4R0RAR4_9APHY|nr:hypothetical protein EIP91_003288 [Steccherinum ochraceum]